MSDSTRDPVRDPQRLQEIVDLGLAGGATVPELQDLAQRAAARLDTPRALVSIVLDEAQSFAASHGVSGWMSEASGTPLEYSYCQHAVRSRDMLAIDDARTDPRVADSPMVQEGVLSYLGVPLTSSRGHVVGTLCVLGDSPRTFSDEDRRALRDLGDEAMRLIEGRRR